MEPRRTNTVAAVSPLEALAAAAQAAEADGRVQFQSHLKWQPEDEAALQSLAGVLSPAPTMQQPIMDSSHPETTAAAGAVAEDGGLARQGTHHSRPQVEPPVALVHVTTTSDQQAVGQHNAAAETTVVVASPLHAAAFFALAATNDAQTETSPDDSPAKNVLQVEFDAARLLKRVVRAFATAEHSDGEIRLRLSPPELGSLTLAMRVEEGALIARVAAETEASRVMLLDNLPLLRERLSEHGMRIERFDVDLMQHQTGDQPQSPPDRDRSNPHVPPATRQPPIPATAPTAERPNQRSPFPRRKRGRLNVVI